jgi:hypothetical protein
VRISPNQACGERFSRPCLSLVGSSPTVDRPPTACSDNEGVELDGIDAVREEATVAARELMSADFLSGLAPDGRRFVVTDEQDVVVLALPFEQAIARA